MMLARMLSVDKAALLCDMAETYHIYNLRALPARQIAIYASGLKEDSRIMRKLSGAPTPFNTMLLAIIADAVRLLVWQNTKDGANGTNVPVSIFSTLVNKEEKEEGFSSVAEFEAWRNSLLGGDG